jgi:hypothetical protein
MRVAVAATALALLAPLASPVQARSKCDQDFSMYMDHVRWYEEALAQRNELNYWSALSGIGYLTVHARSSKTKTWLRLVESEMKAFRIGTYPFIVVQNRLLRGYC